MSVSVSRPSACGRVCVHLSPRGRGVCKVSSLLSCRVGTQPTDTHSLPPRLQPPPLPPLQPLTATGRCDGGRACCCVPTPPLPTPFPKGHLGHGAAAELGFLQAFSPDPAPARNPPAQTLPSLLFLGPSGSDPGFPLPHHQRPFPFYRPSSEIFSYCF